MPRVSVILPVYNADQFLTAAVESVLAQSFVDFELLVHDDGSTDRSLDLLLDFSERDPRVIVSSAPNHGITPTLNFLAEKARSPYLARMDADDVALPHRFEMQVAFLDAHRECVAVGSGIQLIDEDGRKLGAFEFPASHAEIDEGNLNGKVNISHPAAMIRASALSEVGGYREDFLYAQDIDLWLRLAEVGRLANLQEQLLCYRLHWQSISTTKRQQQIAVHKAAVAEAFTRRGLPGEPNMTIHAEPEERVRLEAWRRWGWWALQSKNIKTARHYAMRVLCERPFDIESWRLFACALRGY